MKNKHELKMIEKNVGDKDMVYTNAELKNLVIELVESHLDALNKLQAEKGKADAVRTDSGLTFNSGSLMDSL